MRALMPVGALFLPIGAVFGAGCGIRFAPEIRELPARAQLQWLSLHGGGLRRWSVPAEAHRRHAAAEDGSDDDGL